VLRNVRFLCFDQCICRQLGHNATLPLPWANKDDVSEAKSTFGVVLVGQELRDGSFSKEKTSRTEVHRSKLHGSHKILVSIGSVAKSQNEDSSVNSPHC
jgi:hypothetical protein